MRRRDFRTPLRVGLEAGTIYFLCAIFGSIGSDDCASLLSTSIDKSRKDSFIYATSENSKCRAVQMLRAAIDSIFDDDSCIIVLACTDCCI